MFGRSGQPPSPERLSSPFESRDLERGEEVARARPRARGETERALVKCRRRGEEMTNHSEAHRPNGRRIISPLISNTCSRPRGPWGLDCAPSTHAAREARGQARRPRGRPPSLPGASPGRPQAVPRPSPPPRRRPSALPSAAGKPRAAPAPCAGQRRRAGSATSVSPDPCPRPRPSGQKGQTHPLIKRSHDFMGTPHFVLVASLPRGGGRHIFKRLLA